MQLLSFKTTDKGAEIRLAECSVEEVAFLLRRFMETDDFHLERGTALSGSWGSGGSRARFFVGAMASRRKYDVEISAAGPSEVHVSVASAMSGWSGSVVGVIKEKNQRRDFAARLRESLSTLPTSIAPAPSTDATTSELERLAALRANGLLTEGEFAAAKRRVLGGSGDAR